MTAGLLLLAIASGLPGGPLLEAALAGPLAGVREVVFVPRLPYDDGHYYAGVGYHCDSPAKKAYAGSGRADVGKLCALDLRTGEVRTILDGEGGSIRDPQVHHDGARILFSWRKAGTDPYHLFEVGADGSGLRQITAGPFDDYEAIYLPDGDLLFVSTRCRRWVASWTTQVGTLYRSGPGGDRIEAVSASTGHDDTPWMLPDGRVLYTRWEFVDRSHVDFHHLWAMRPDGTGQAVFFGNQIPGTVMIDAKPIPGTDQVVASFSPGHGLPDHAGTATVVSPALGPDDPAAARPFSRGKPIRDPYPLSAGLFLAARDDSLVLLDAGGESEVLYRSPGREGLHEPRPIAPRPREPVLARRTDPGVSTGQFVLADLYDGRNLPGVRRGEVKRLLVLETLPKPVNFTGGQDLTSWLGTFHLERVLGTVPVEEDGSAYFEAPAGRPLHFVALDAAGLSVKRMQSFASLAPGEVQGCAGCHERRETAVPGRAALTSLRRPPSRIEPFAGYPDVPDFPRDIQPILDRHCVRCHGPRRREGHVLLTGDRGPSWSHSYFALLAARQVADGRNGLGNQSPRSIGSAASPLLAKAAGGHHDVEVPERERRMLWLWIEAGAPWAGTYAALRNEDQMRVSASAVSGTFRLALGILGRRCGTCHAIGEEGSAAERPIPFHADFSDRRGIARPTARYERLVIEDDPQLRYSVNILLDFTHPEDSPLLLGPLAPDAGGWGSCGTVLASLDDPDAQALLAALRRGADLWEAAGLYGTDWFRPNRQYVREMVRFGIVDPQRDLVKDPLDPFACDRLYWLSLWPEMSGGTPAGR